MGQKIQHRFRLVQSQLQRNLVKASKTKMLESLCILFTFNSYPLFKPFVGDCVGPKTTSVLSNLRVVVLICKDTNLLLAIELDFYAKNEMKKRLGNRI